MRLHALLLRAVAASLAPLVLAVGGCTHPTDREPGSTHQADVAGSSSMPCTDDIYFTSPPVGLTEGGSSFFYINGQRIWLNGTNQLFYPDGSTLWDGATLYYMDSNVGPALTPSTASSILESEYNANMCPDACAGADPSLGQVQGSTTIAYSVGSDSTLTISFAFEGVEPGSGATLGKRTILFTPQQAPDEAGAPSVVASCPPATCASTESACSADDDCCTGGCVGGLCLLPTGAHCEANYLCASGKCVPQVGTPAGFCQ